MAASRRSPAGRRTRPGRRSATSEARERILARRWLAGVVVALTVLTATARAGPHVTGNRTLVIGDSIVYFSQDQVRAALTADGWHAIVVGAGGYRVESWQPLVAPLAGLARPNVAVVELGTNDCNLSCPDLAPAIDDIMVTLIDHGAGAVLWLNVQTRSPYPRQADAVNYQIEQAAVRWPQLEIVDLRDFFDPHPEWHVFDLIHPNAIGEVELGVLIRSALHPDLPAAAGPR